MNDATLAVVGDIAARLKRAKARQSLFDRRLVEAQGAVEHNRQMVADLEKHLGTHKEKLKQEARDDR